MTFIKAGLYGLYITSFWAIYFLWFLFRAQTDCNPIIDFEKSKTNVYRFLFILYNYNMRFY